METPRATDTVRVRDNQYPHTVLPGQSLGMTAFKIWDITRDPQGGAYLLLAGMWSQSDTNNAYDEDILVPSDKRFIAACDPFDLPNDYTAKFGIHIIGANDSLDLIRKAELVGVESPPIPVSRNASGVVLYPSIPNPTSSPCLIRYALPEQTSVTLRIYDVCGRLVKELDKGKKPSGSPEAVWSGRDDLGRTVPVGGLLLSP